jgi:metal iron transporter
VAGLDPLPTLRVGHHRDGHRRGERISRQWWNFANSCLQVIGTAIALNLLLRIPLVGGCAISIVDVLIILLFYSPDGSVKRLRFFEMFVMALVLGVVVCFCIQLSLLQDTSIGEVFRGYLPSSAIVKSNGYYPPFPIPLP